MSLERGSSGYLIGDWSDFIYEYLLVPVFSILYQDRTNFRGFFVNARHLITVVTTFYYELETGLHYSTTSTHEGFRVPTITAAHPPLYRKAMKRLVGRSFLRSVIATLGCGVDIYGYRRLNCSKSSCLEHLGRRYKFYLAIENSNCRAYLTEKLFRTALR
ncbi:Glycoprotein 3-alpha-L-fucosyltransferase A [Echinococcus granulosus]|uniref:Fucosyltransferase n=1 Tax=Echinococcus granulosus TaxID=6210 RepID=W6UZT7_ECHGR|nr:Glycoprotein 3-alpha-L-fucosyltransferase A [Echinococcus granulosus]EUB59169.1 Glycoprotein 3-alpha-L-fucosyltransferase A [Echinococcus granulosus]